MTGLQEVVKVFDGFFKVSAVPTTYEIMVFECDAEGNIFNIENPVYEKHYSSQEEVKKDYEVIVNVYNKAEIEGFTMDKWHVSILDTLKENDFVHDDVVMDLVNCVPPRKYSRNIAQIGERQNANGYMTFKKSYGLWYYAGLEN